MTGKQRENMQEEFERYRQEEEERGRLAAELAAGETVLWQQAPARGAMAGQNLFGRVFGIFWLGFSLFWFTGALQAAQFGGFGLIFPLFGLPFIGIGIWIVFVLPGRQKRQLSTTIYAVTDRRLIIFSSAPTRSVRSLPLQCIRSVSKRFHRDGTGDLYFDIDPAAWGYGGMDYGYRGRRSAPFAFYGIDADAAQRAVQLRLDELQRGGGGYGA